MTLSPGSAADRLDKIFFRWVFPALLAGILLTYIAFRQRYIGAVDWYGYYQLGELLKTGHVFLTTPFSISDYPAIVPFGFFPDGARAVPQYPPGFPLLLAAGSLAGLTFFVTPLIGVGSCVLLFVTIRDLTDRWIAALFTLAWAFFPIVVFGSTTFMSDLAAATGLLGAYFAYRRGRLFLSAWVLGFSFCVRPTNVLFLGLFALLLLRDRQLIRYGCYLLGPVLLYAWYNHAVYGAAWRTGYGDISIDLSRDVFRQHSGFYLWQTFLQCSPLIVVLALWGLRPWSLEKLFFLLWFTSYLLFYSFWRSGGDRWWWTRFLLPGFVPLFLLAASGLARVRDALLARSGGLAWRNGYILLLFALAALVPAWEIYFGWSQRDLWKTNKAHEYYDVTQMVAATARPGSLVGSVEFGGSFRLYTNLVPYLSVHSSSPQLIEHALQEGRDVYLILETWNQPNQVIRSCLIRFSAEKIRVLPVWDGPTLYRLHLPSPAAAVPAAAGK